MSEIAKLIKKARSAALEEAQRHEAFGELVIRFQDMAVGYAFSFLSDFQRAEDAAQEAFIEAYRNLDNLDQPKAFPGWFRQIVFRQCYRMTHKKSLPTESIEIAKPMPSLLDEPSQAAVKGEMKDQVLAAIWALPEKQRTVTTLFYINGYSQNEISDFLEIRTQTVKSRLHTARKQLKERLVDEMVQQTLAQQRPSRDNKFVKEVLFKAIEEADPQKAAELLNSKPQLISATNEKGQTPILALTRTGSRGWFFNQNPDGANRRRAIYDLLTKKGATPDFPSSIIANDLDRVRVFVGAAPELVKKRLADNRLPLTLAAAYGRVEIMELLVETGAEINADNDTALFSAIGSDVFAVEWLIEAGANVNSISKQEWGITTALIGACHGLNLEVVKVLLAHGADPNLRCESKSPLEAAICSWDRMYPGGRSQQRAIVQALLSAGAKHEDHALWAVRLGQSELLEEYLDADDSLVHKRYEIQYVCDSPFTPVNGATLLHVACEYDELECAKLLIERGADVNTRIEKDAMGIGGSTPIFNVVAQNVYSPLLECLIGHGADLTVKAVFDRFWVKDGFWVKAWPEEPSEFTPLGYAILSQNSWHTFNPDETRKIIEILRKHGAPE